jgi:putative methyltransferase (TIGR04325 family)
MPASASPSPPEWEMVPDNDQIWNAHAGWSHQSIVQTQLSKWPQFLRSVAGPQPLGQSHEAPAGQPADFAAHNTIMSFGYALGLVAAGRTRVSILDWGGGLGHYYVYARRLFPQLELDFTIKDLPAFCVVGASSLPEVAFISDEQQALSQSYDLVFASSSVHYTRDPYGLMERLCACAREWLMLTRMPFVERSDDFVVVQRPHRYGYLTEYPGWFMNRQRFLDFIRNQGFSLERQFLVAEQPNVPNAPEQAHYYGFLFRRQASATLAVEADEAESIDMPGGQDQRYFGLNNLDQKLEKYLNFDDGFYVELGASDGIRFSNTYYYELHRGWRGVLVEPAHNRYLECRKNRGDRNHVVCAACVSSGYQPELVNLLYCDLMTVPLGLESDIISPAAHAEIGRQFLQGDDRVFEFAAVARTLSSILTEAKAPKLIDFMSLDVEGAEIEVLKGIDYEQFKFRYLLVETRQLRKLERFLASVGYRLVEKFDEHDYLFCPA